jgi:alpha-mannosidase
MPTLSSTGNILARDASGHALPTQVLSSDATTGRYHLLVEANDVPPLGFSVLHVAADDATQKTDLHVEGTTLENSRLRVVIDPKTGCITHLIDRATNFDSIADTGCGNQLQTFPDKPKKYDAWNIDREALAHMTPISAVDSIDVVDRGPVRASVRIRRHWGTSTFEQTVVLYSNLDRVDLENHIDWHETHVLLKAAFPLAASGPFATYEIPYGTIDRATTRDNSWEKAQFEVPAQQWADLGDGKHGLSLINESKFGYDAAGNTLRLTLLRSPKWPDPDADMGHHHFHYALYPHAGTWKDAMTVRHGFEYNYPLTAVVTTAHAGTLPAEHSFASVSPDNVVLTAVKKAEDAKGLIFRVYEWAGKESTVEFHVPPGASGATVTNMMEVPEGAALAVMGDVVKAPIHPYEILTIRVDYPNGGPKE